MYALVCDDVPPVIASVLNSRVLAPKAPEPVATQPSAAAVNVWSPVSSLPVSACQLPASRPAPSVQARKSAGRGKNPFLFTMLFEKNIEIFSDPNPSVLCVFSICLPPFRAWTGTGESGRYNAPGLPELLGGFSAYTFDAGMPWQAITSVDSGMNALTVGSSGGTRYNAFTFRASLSNTIYGASSTVMPPSVNLPVILYLGIPA